MAGRRIDWRKLAASWGLTMPVAACVNMHSSQSDSEAPADAVGAEEDEGQEAKQWRALTSKAKEENMKGRHKEAIALLDKAKRVADTCFEESDARRAAALQNYAEACRVAGRKEEAIPLYKEAMERLLESGRFAACAEAMANLGSLQSELGERKEAVHSMRKALQYQKQANGESSKPYAITLTRHAGILLASNRNREAAHAAREAEKAFRVIGDDVRATASAIPLIAIASARSGNKGRAKIVSFEAERAAMSEESALRRAGVEACESLGKDASFDANHRGRMLQAALTAWEREGGSDYGRRWASVAMEYSRVVSNPDDSIRLAKRAHETARRRFATEVSKGPRGWARPAREAELLAKASRNRDAVQSSMAGDRLHCTEEALACLEFVKQAVRGDVGWGSGAGRLLAEEASCLRFMSHHKHCTPPERHRLNRMASFAAFAADRLSLGG